MENEKINLVNNKQYHKMTRLEINNYMHSHNVESITSNTLLDFFGPHIYDEVEGYKHYFTHEICSCHYDIVKICKALESAFPFLGPNMCELNYGENFFQTFMFNYIQLGCNKLDEEIQILLIESLLKLGFQYGLDPQFKTLNEGNTMWHYLCLSIDNFKVLEHVFNWLKNKKFDSLTRNYHNIDFIDYLFAKVTNVYRYYAMYNSTPEEFELEKEFYISTNVSYIPIIWFQELGRKEYVARSKKVDDKPLSLFKIYCEEFLVTRELCVAKMEVDPLLRRFLTKYNLLYMIEEIVEDYHAPVPLVYDHYVLEDEFSLQGYGTLYNFIKFYNMLVENYDYNRDGEETVNTLKRILKRDDKKDNKE